MVTESTIINASLKQAADGARSEPIRIVVVDDHRLVLDGISRLLDAEADFEVVATATTVAEARRLVADTVPDVAIVDYSLPDGDGAVLTREILSTSPTTKVVVLTGAHDERFLAAAMEAGCAGFLTKDRATDELSTAIRMAAAGEAYVPTSLVTSLLSRIAQKRNGLGSDLTAREREILVALRSGATNPQIASEIFLSVNTVRNHVQNILLKLGAHSKLEAIAIATREGLFDS